MIDKLKGYIMKTRLILPIILIITIVFLFYTSFDSPFRFQTFEGHIIEDNTFSKKFYIQENEGGDIVELKFIHEESELLSFAEFGYVLIDGHYNPKDNYIIVNEIQSINEKSGIFEGIASNE